MFTDDEMEMILTVVSEQKRFIDKVLHHVPGLLSRSDRDDLNELHILINNAITRWNAAKPSYRVEREQ